MKIATRLMAFIASGYVLMFFSEYFFVNEEPAFTLIEALTSNSISVFFLLEFMLIYTFFSYAMLIVLQRFKVNDIWGLILAGALFGWWTEGVIIPLMYEALPITIFFPSIGWHVLVDVLIGWYLFRRLLHINKYYLTIIVTIAMGVFWGFWATWFWVESSEKILPSHFVLYTFVSSILLGIAYWIMDRYRFNSLNVSKYEIFIFIIISLGSLILLSFTYGLIPWLVLGPMAGLTLFALYRGNKLPAKSSLSFDGDTMWWQYPILLLIPLTASITYNIIYSSGRILILGDILPFILLILGAIVYLIAIYRNIRQLDLLKD